MATPISVQKYKQDLAEETMIKMALKHADNVLIKGYENRHPQSVEYILKFPDQFTIEEITEAFGAFEEALDKILRLTKDNILDKVIPK